MRRARVESSSIHSVGYADRVLEVRFHNGGLYRYFDVPEEVYDGLMRADSMGRFFNSRVRDAYRYLRLDPARSG